MKNINKFLFGFITILLLISILGSQYVAAAGDGSGAVVPKRNIEVNGNAVQSRVRANERTMLQFQERTRITINSSVNINLYVNCEANEIGEKDFELEVTGTKDMQMLIKCTEEQSELGLLNGSTVQVRNQYRHRYQEGFCVSIECGESCNLTQARLKIKANEENQAGTWAYYDENTEEWVAVPTTLQNGYLVAETGHFSTWTILIPEIDYIAIIFIGIIGTLGVIAVVSLIFYLKKK